MTVSLHPFPYDPFQRRAIEAIDTGKSLLVAAPTGSGKTVLADYVIERSLEERQRVIYTAPIKALSNQKFRDFTARHGEETVGILTGDVTIHPRAPLIIMTTEIYRNTLLEDPERMASYGWIIFDEIHYLDDPDRGTVWEEAILFTPRHMKLLCLSATIPNVAQLAQWLRSVHEHPVEVIEETQRPVPLTIAFQCQNRMLADLEALNQHGYRRMGGAILRRASYQDHHRALHPNRVDVLLQHLIDHEHLPCIFFTFGRRRTEELAWEVANRSLLNPTEQQALLSMFTTLCERFQLTQDHSVEALRRLIARGVAFHHAGMLPTVKEVLERCFTSRLLKLIVTTETFALGVNMPARSVVLDTIKKRSGGGFELLRRREFLQMAGRAGRRGMDEAGNVYLRINPLHASYAEVTHLLHATPEPVHSRFNTTYATLLNLYRRHGRDLLDLFPKTLYAFQTTGPRRAEGLSLMQRKLDLLEAMGYLTPTELTPKGLFGSYLYGYELLLTELYTEAGLSALDVTALALLVAGMVYEPRPGTEHPKPHRLSRRLSQLCQEPLQRIHGEEHRFRISPKSKATAFHLSHALEAWMGNAAFSRITRLCDADEGEIVRYFRMTVQLLRQLSETPAADERLRLTALKAFRRINRDVIDAEAQLRLG